MKLRPIPRSCGPVFLAALGLLAASPLATAQTTPLKVLKKVPPEFPAEAARRKISEGVLKAKVSVDGQGAVTNVQIIEAVPERAKVFNESAISALSRWKFESTGKADATEIKLVFSQDE
ncbi:energy transducer TonB [Piscinibacter gummiphilus]|uniref:energy transducer TonB n=1 Tax=Piscinibacter gummiphilus TaxID=946333 RepID=UPI00235D90F3|nr:energy transducer TonB [Piscinibacter gummiphilus]GLS93486.1 hypothetical protein GCM10007918_07770 [Piscinibacter gummiphilus]